MSLWEKFKKIRNDYVINQVQNTKLPEFEDSEIKRMQFIFEGRVQQVGFRIEVAQLAERLNLTGICMNLEDGRVLAELQGPLNKIYYVVDYMHSLKRIKITNKEVKELEIIEKKGFVMR